MKFQNPIIYVLLLAGLLASQTVLSQDIQTPNWSVNLDGDVKWLKQTSTGMLIAYSTRGLFGVDPEAHKIVWQKKWPVSLQNALKDGLSANAFQEIDGTPYARIQEDSDNMLTKNQTSIINFLTGEDIFTSKGANITIDENTPMFSIGAMLLQIRQDKKDYLILLDVATGQERWRTELIGIKHHSLLSIKGAINMTKKILGINQNAVPRLDKDANILFPQGETLTRFDGKTGKQLWQAKFDDKVGRLEFSEKGDVVYAGAGKYIMGYSLDKGETVWKDPYKVPGKFKYFVPMAEATLLAVTENGITRIDEATGKSVWKKPNYVDLELQTVEFLNDGMLVLSSSKNGSQFDYIDYAGKDLWRKSYKTDKPVTTYEITGKGLLFANAEEANVIDFKDGRDDIWKRRIKLRGNPVVYIDRSRNAMLLYSNDKLYTVDLTDLSNKLLAEDIKFRGHDEDVERIEPRKDGYLLSSSQNMWLIGYDGKPIYNKFYREPGAGKRALAIVGQAASTYGAVAGSVNFMKGATTGLGNSLSGNEAEANKNLRSASNSIALWQVSNGANEAFSQLYAKRYKSAFTTQDAQYILAGIEQDGSVKRTGLIKINKDTGTETGKILLKDMTPIYVVDDVANSLHVIVDANKFYSYSL